MKIRIGKNGRSWKPAVTLARAFVVAGFLFAAASGLAQILPGGDDGGPTNTPLDSWSFLDHTNWTSDLGYAPVSFTNINYSYLGDGNSLVVDTNVPAWLQYNVIENDNTTNLTVDNGSVTFWFGPDWSSADDTNGGFGPQEYGRLFEVGGYTTNSSYGWWSIYVDSGGTNLYFSSQTNDGLGDTYTLSTPIDWTTNYFHFIALTYSATNVSLYLDGVLATNDPGGLSLWPGTNVLSNGFYIGSGSNGVAQAHGMFDIVETFDYPLDSNDVQQIYQWESPYYEINPYNTAMESIVSAPSTPAYVPSYNAISGPGFLQWVTNVSDCVTSSNVWITNVVATAVGSGTNATMNLTFTIEGGVSGAPYDVFANSILDFSSDTNKAWAWMGQGYQCNTYTITNLPSSTCFLILGTPQDSDGDGLTDAYELLVSKTDPDNYDTDGDGISDSDEVLEGTDPHTPNSAIPSSLNIETCPQ
ncbi:MAG: LamG-like jellyroll fold domain-containing protein [Limisphaerales bacterium]